MVNVIQQRITLNAPPEALFDTYIDSKRHAAVIGDKVLISRKAGTTFSAFDGSLTGRNLLIVPNRMIVQSWRAKIWKKTDPDSILILQFNKVAGGGRIDLIHTNVPDHAYQVIKKGWLNYYWKPWKASLKRARRG